MNLTVFFTLSSFHSLPITQTCQTPNGQYLLLFPSLLSVLLVILARRRVCHVPAAAAGAVRCQPCVPYVPRSVSQHLLRRSTCRQHGSELGAGVLCLIRAVDLVHPNCSVLTTSCLDWVTQVHVSQRSVSLWKILNVSMRAKHLLSCCVKEAYCVRTQLGAFPSSSSSLGVELRSSHRFKGKERNICEELGSHFGELSCPLLLESMERYWCVSFVTVLVGRLRVERSMF